ncbi:MAG: FAD-binding protein, partial [Planctomycetes bacterium]|nr:FAD-binding protein [Planctomycetota bacterium]
MSVRLVSALRERLGNRVVFDDPATLHCYESDALTLFLCKPAAVVIPKNRDQVIQCVQVLHEHRIPFAARGAGTGLSGGTNVPEGGVLICMAKLNQVLEVHPEQGWARVEPGIVNANLSRQMAHHDLCFAPDPASQTVSTIGGNVAENSGGPHCFRYGMTAQHLLGAEVVLADGSVETWTSIEESGGGPDLRGLLLGSEGSLAIALALDVRLLPTPEAITTMLIAFPSVEKACAAISDIVANGLQPAALEVMDQTAIIAVEDSIYRCGLPRDAGAVLLLEVEGPSDVVSRDAQNIRALIEGHNVLSIEEAQSEAQRTALWKGRKGAGGALGRLAPDSYVMDGVVPRSKLSEVMAFVAEVQAETKLPVANLFHAGDGNIHPHFSYDGRNRSEAVAVERAGIKILRKCLELGGSISGEHGIGLEKEHLLAEQYSAPTLDLMRRLGRA